MNRTKEDAEKTRKQLIDASISIFINKGYSATKLDDIAKEAQASRGAIAYHFKNKETLYRTIIKESLNSTKELFVDIIKMPLVPNEVIEKLIATLIDERQTKYLQITILNNLVKENKDEFIDLIEMVQSHFDFIIGKLADTIMAGIEKGIFKEHLDATFTAKAIFTFVSGILSDTKTRYKEYGNSDLKLNILEFYRGAVLIK